MSEWRPDDIHLITRAPPGAFFDDLRLRAAGDRYEITDSKGRKITVTRVYERKVAMRLLRDAERYPHGHRNWTKAQRRALGLEASK